MESLLRLLMGPWTTYILWVLHSNGPTRFGELKRRVTGVSAKMLTERLRMLEISGVVFRDHRPSVPPQVTYSLTPRGQELRQVLDELSALASRWQAADARAADGQVATPEEAAAPAMEAAPAEARPRAPQAAESRAGEAQANETGANERPANERPAAAHPPYVSAAE